VTENRRNKPKKDIDNNEKFWQIHSMITSRKNRYVSYIAVLFGLGLAGSADATVLVDWGNSTDYVTASQGIVNSSGPTYVDDVAPPGSKTRTAVYAYSAVSSSVPASGYTPPSGKSGVFYTGSYLTSENTDDTVRSRPWSSQVVQDGGAISDRILYTRGGAAVIDLTAASFVSFLKADFLNGGSGHSGINFDLTSEISMTITASTGSINRYYAVQDGSQWYISQTSYNTNGAKSLSGATLASEKWGAWSPTGGADGRLGDLPGSFTTDTADFTDLSAFGIFTTYLGPGSTIGSGISAITVSAVPEPGTVTLTALGALLLCFGEKSPNRSQGNAAS